MAGVDRGAVCGRMDNLKRDEGEELVVSRFDRFCACVHDLGEKKRRIHLSIEPSIAEIHFGSLHVLC